MTNADVHRTIRIEAAPETVWPLISTTEGLCRWMGAGCSIDPRLGGGIRLAMPGGAVAIGAVTAIEAGRRVSFTFGYESGQPLPAGSTTVEVVLSPTDDGATTASITHRGIGDAAIAFGHALGWQFQAVRLSQSACEAMRTRVSAAIASWSAAWSSDNPSEIQRLLRDACTDDVSFKDAFGVANGLQELCAHVAACRQFAPATRLVIAGPPRLSQGWALVDWRVEAAHGVTIMAGSNACQLAPDGRLRAVVGFSAP